MTSRSKSTDTILLEAVELPTAAERAAYLDRECGDNTELRQELEKLIADHFDAGSFLEHPAARLTESLRQAADRAVADAEPRLDFLAPCEDASALGKLGSYTVNEVIGRGGMGIVLKGHDPRLNRTVAIKVLAPELAGNAAARKRFVREGQAAAAVAHQHVVAVYAVDEEPLPYLVMECIHGQSLQQRIDQKGPLELKEVLRIGTQVAAGLAAAHAHGVIHRDIKPANILLENGIERVRITDFGLARAVDDVAVTRTGELAGTPQYMSPEQAQGQPVDARSDLFNLGCVLYAMCTGRSPFRAETTVGAIRRVCDDTPRPIREVNADIPQWLAELIDRLLHKDPEQRIQTAAELAERLSQHLAHLQDPNSMPAPGSLPKPRNRRGFGLRPWLVAAVIAVCLLVCLGLTESSGVTQVLGTIVSLVRGDGTLVVEIDDPGVSVAIEGEDLVITGAGAKEFRLRPGEYRLHGNKGGQEVALKQELVTITRGGRRVVRVSLEGNSQTRASEPFRFAEHHWGVWKVSFAADGRRVLSLGGPDVRVWEVPGGDVLRRIGGYEGPQAGWARCGCFFPAGPRADWIVVGANAGVVRVFDVALGRELQRFAVSASLQDLAVTPDGERIIALTGNGAVVVWNVQQQRQEFRHQLNMPRTRDLAISPDGTRALTSGYDGLVRYWEIESGKVLRDFELPMGDVAFSPDGRQALVGRLRHILLVDLETGTQVRRFAGHPGNTATFTFSPDGRHAISGGDDRIVRVWDVETGQQIAAFAGHTEQICDVAISPDGHLALSSSFRPDTAVRVWQLPERVWKARYSKQRDNAGGNIADSGQTPPVLSAGEVLRFEEHAWTVWRVDFSPDGQSVLSLGGPDVLVWETATGKILKRFAGFEGPTTKWARCGRFFPRGPWGKWIVVAGNEGVVRVFDVESGDEVRRFEGSHSIADLDVVPDGRRVLVGSDSGEAIVWDPHQGREEFRYKLHAKPLRSASLSSDGRRALTAGYDDAVLYWEVDTGKVLHHLVTPKGDAAFSPDGTYALLSAGEPVRLVDLATGRDVRRFDGHRGNTARVTFTRDGRHALSVGDDRTVRVWNVKTGELVASFVGHTHSPTCVAVSPDGRLALSASLRPEATVRMWRLPESVWTEKTVDESNEIGSVTSDTPSSSDGEQIGNRSNSGPASPKGRAKDRQP